jgi:hypothetical protein
MSKDCYGSDLEILLSSGQSLPQEVVRYTLWPMFALVHELNEVAQSLKTRLEQLEAKRNQDSSNSNKPLSSGSPFKINKPKISKESKRRKGVGQQYPPPTEVTELPPGPCICGCFSLLIYLYNTLFSI